MTQEEKLEEAKRLYETANADQKYVLKSLFPELAESEDERIRKNCIHFLELQKQHHAATFEIEECIAWLEKQGEQKPAWSEEDERVRIETIELLETANHPNVLHRNGKPLDFTENINWLKSLRPQNWKPSCEQMKVLNEVLNFAANHESPHWNDYIFGALNNLIRQLKKLREE